ncbi:hypothetical protein PSHT_14543 [Puccinia striiformis]|uniref:Uncharacterized protein n=1 Tax=Puccinia striiformis TaxID=27350 RepID=A0A2S4UK36_9BASI|nr:hypothetical protein PSHT_14543 [Puccinia striiformis]
MLTSLLPAYCGLSLNSFACRPNVHRQRINIATLLVHALGDQVSEEVLGSTSKVKGAPQTYPTRHERYHHQQRSIKMLLSISKVHLLISALCCWNFGALARPSMLAGENHGFEPLVDEYSERRLSDMIAGFQEALEGGSTSNHKRRFENGPPFLLEAQSSTIPSGQDSSTWHDRPFLLEAQSSTIPSGQDSSTWHDRTKRLRTHPHADSDSWAPLSGIPRDMLVRSASGSGGTGAQHHQSELHQPVNVTPSEGAGSKSSLYSLSPTPSAAYPSLGIHGILQEEIRDLQLASYHLLESVTQDDYLGSIIADANYPDVRDTSTDPGSVVVGQSLESTYHSYHKPLNVKDSAGHSEIIPNILESNADTHKKIDCPIRWLENLRASLNDRFEKLETINNPSFNTLRLSSLPDELINQQFLENQVQHFFSHMKNTMNKYPLGSQSWQKYKMDGLPASKILIPNSDDLFIQVLGENVWVEQNTESLKNNLKSIIKWLTTINTAVLQLLSSGELMEIDSFSNAQLLNWFLGQAFEPKKSYPVFGIVDKKLNLNPGEEFGLIQKILLAQLSRNKPEEYSFEASIMIMSSFYKERRPKLWKYIRTHHETNVSISPIEKLALITCKAVDSCITSVAKQTPTFTNPKTLGQFKIVDFSTFPATMKPQRFLFDRVDPSVKPLMDLVILGSSNFMNRPLIKVKGLPMQFHQSTLDCSENGICKWRIRITEGDQNQFTLSIIFRKVEYTCHQFKDMPQRIITQLSCKGKNLPQNLLDSVDEWYHNILCGDGGKILPIIGDVECPLPKLQHSDFNEVQIHLIEEYFNAKKAYEKSVWVAISLLGYWYTKFHPNLFFPTLMSTGIQ